jgi:cell division protein FtsZ
MGTVAAAAGGVQAAADYSHLSTPSVWRHGRTQAAAKVDALASNGMDEIEIPAFLRKQAD